jgi:MoaA/NifB/PqqE/SkfB family radical SAM enzyme
MTFCKNESRPPRALGIILNDRCGLRCKHCSLSYDANYRGTSWKIEENELRRVIMEADATVYRTVIMAGGEPALVPQLLQIGIQACREKQIFSAVVTAPVWARTRKSASEFFNRVRGLSIVMLSYDVFHLEFITVEHYANAIQEAKAAGVQVFLNLCYSNPEEQASLLENIAHVRDLVDQIHYQPVLPFGNAAANEATIKLEKQKVESVEDLMRVKRSCVAGNALLNRDGSLYPCCWAAKVEDSPLKFQHLRGLGFRFSSLLMEEDPAFQAVRDSGLIDSLSPEATAKAVELVRGESFVNECDLCVRLMKEGSGTFRPLLEAVAEVV